MTRPTIGRAAAFINAIRHRCPISHALQRSPVPTHTPNGIGRQHVRKTSTVEELYKSAFPKVQSFFTPHKEATNNLMMRRTSSAPPSISRVSCPSLDVLNKEDTKSLLRDQSAEVPQQATPLATVVLRSTAQIQGNESCSTRVPSGSTLCPPSVQNIRPAKQKRTIYSAQDARSDLPPTNSSLARRPHLASGAMRDRTDDRSWRFPNHLRQEIASDQNGTAVEQTG